MKTLSSNVIEILVDSWSSGTRKQYLPYIKKWIEHCESKNIDPVTAPTWEGAEFLTKLFNSSTNGYSAMGTARSVLSGFIEPRQGVTFGKQPLIKRLLRGMFKRRPSLPKYVVTYGVDIVFNYLNSLASSEVLSLKWLSFRLASLLCILSGQRAQTIGAIHLDYMLIEDHRCICYIPEILKVTRPSYHQPPLEFVSYPDSENLCVVKNIQEYIKRTQTLRSDRTLFVSYVLPHKTVTTATIAKWVLEVLRNSGINTTVFSTHSTRSASTSKAESCGLSLADIGKAGGGVAHHV